VSNPTSGPFDTPPPPPSGPWASDNLPPHPMSGYAPQPVEQPPSIRTAVRLMYLGAALSLVSALLTFTQTDAIRDAVEDSDDSLTASEVDTIVNTFVAAFVVAGLIGAGLWVWMAVKNGQGRSWARVVATVLGALNIVFTVLGLGSATSVTLVSSLVSLALAGVILYLMYRPESTRFYDFRSRT
jgi:uncharacterized membrane protein